MTTKIDRNIFKGSKDASRLLGIHPRTLYIWESKGIIETIRSGPGGKRFYNVDKYFTDKEIKCNLDNKMITCLSLEEIKQEQKRNICYVRISSTGQQDDLEMQKELLKNKYPNYDLIEDIGSRTDLTKKGILEIINSAIEGRIEELVIVHKYILTRYGYELIEYLIDKYSKGKITIVEKNGNIEPKEELVKDVIP